jgi:CheY-like chemotaxis protein
MSGGAVVLVERDPAARSHFAALVERSRVEAVAVADRAGLERAVRIHDVAIVALAKGCGLEPLEAREILDAAGRRAAEVRVVDDYVTALVGDLVEYERMLALAVSLVERFERALADAGGARAERVKRASREARLVAERLLQPRRTADAAALAAAIVALEPALARVAPAAREREHLEPGFSRVAPARGGVAGPTPPGAAEGEGRIAALFDGLAAPLGLQPILAALAAPPRSPTAGPMAARIVRGIRARLDALENDAGPAAVEAVLRSRAGVDLDPEVVEAVLAVGAPDKALAAPKAERPEVVIVDPSAAASAPLETRLASHGYDVRAFRDGQLALAAIGARPPALVVSEVATPGLDGFSLLVKIRSGAAARAGAPAALVKRLRETPFVLVTDHADAASVRKGMDLGAQEVLQKPLQPDLFLAKAEALVARARGGA